MNSLLTDDRTAILATTAVRREMQVRMNQLEQLAKQCEAAGLPERADEYTYRLEVTIAAYVFLRVGR